MNDHLSEVFGSFNTKFLSLDVGSPVEKLNEKVDSLSSGLVESNKSMSSRLAAIT